MTGIPALTIAGYADRMSVAPGGTVRFMVSEEGDARTYTARLMRMFTMDDNPAGPGLVEEEVGSAFDGEYAARRQVVRTGSCIAFPEGAWLRNLSSLSIQAYLWPTTPGRNRQTMVAHWDGVQGFRLELDEAGALSLVLRLPGAGEAERRFSTGVALRPREWVRVVASWDARSGMVSLRQEPLRRRPVADTAARAIHAGPAMTDGCWPSLPLSIAAHSAGAGTATFAGHYNGKIDRLRISGDVLSNAALEALCGPAPPAPGDPSLLAFWDFGRDMGSCRVHDLSAWRRDGFAVNIPARGMTGFNWTGDQHDFKTAPEQYGAIHFHDDDLYDAEWASDFAWTVPAGCPSGVYAVKLEDGNVPGYIVFFVRPPRHPPPGTRPPVVFVASTATYLAYANYRTTERDPAAEASRGRIWQFGPEDILMHRRLEFGNSTYGVHSDGSGVCHSSRLRPILSLRPNTRLSGIAGDAYVIGFLRHCGFEVDVVTDEDLHREGMALLRPYALLMTGGHPEYMSREMWDGIEGFLHGGGRLMYLGGNGFYWRIAFHSELPGVMEVRRSEGGTRPWAADPGEYYMAFTGEYGGMWRRNGRPPNTLVGIGFTAQGFDVASCYRRMQASRDPRAAFIFQGVDADVIGNFGLGFGGAAGQEIDRYDPALGSPPHALLLARSEGHTDHMLLAIEDMRSTHMRVGGVESQEVRADMVFFETGYGGAVFSVGSISWVSALPCFGYDNNIAAVTRNVVQRFVDPEPFEALLPLPACGRDGSDR